MVVGVCGYGYSGSGAVLSLLKEYSNIQCLPGGHEDIEFNITYFPDGIEDLEYHLCINPAKGTGSDTAIYRFQLLVKDFERSHNRYTNNQFKKISEDYINKIAQIEWPAYRLFEYDRQKGSLYRNVKRYKLIISNLLKRLLKVDVSLFPTTYRYLSIRPDDFLECSRNYISKIIGDKDIEKIILLNQPFSVTNPMNGMKFFEDSFCIIVDRDPRDLYVMVKHIYGNNALFIPTDKVENFVEYYKRIRSTVNRDDKRILYIQFEDLIYHYEETVKIIESFLEQKIGVHIKSKEYFNPEISVNNTFIYKNYEQDNSDIKYIEEQLRDYLYPFDSNTKANKNVNLSNFTFM